MTPEPEDKLDATTNVVVNGPEDAPFDWRQVDWRRVEDEVRRLRQRIFTASQAASARPRAIGLACAGCRETGTSGGMSRGRLC